MKIRLFRQWLIFCFVFCSATAGAAVTTIHQVELLNISGKQRIVFSSKQPINYHAFTLKSPDRFVVDFSNVVLTYNINKLPIHETNIQQIKTGHPKKNTLRVVFYLKNPVATSEYTLKPKGWLDHRLIVNLLPKAATVITAKPHIIVVNRAPKKNVVSLLPTFVEPRVTKTAVQYQTDSSNDAVIVIDPGHGGSDPGATGQMGAHEKNIVLQISTDLYNILKNKPGIKPYMTRYTDHFVSLRGRLKFARSDKANLFVAIHADAFYDHNAAGATVFALSPHGATSEAARWLAERENYSELAGVSLSDKNQLLRSVLLDLSQTSTTSQSVVLGNQVRDALSHVTSLHSHIVEQAAFVVLKSPDIPSILVETGFLSNRAQEQQLKDGDFQMKIAEALANGIEEYLHRYPPVGTVFSKTG